MTPLNQNKRHGLVGPLLSPPDLTVPTSAQNARNSKTREVESASEDGKYQNNSDADVESVDEADHAGESGVNDSSDGEDIMEFTQASMVFEAPTAPEVPHVPLRPRSLSIEPVEITIIEILIEEITEDDVEYDSDVSVLFPCHCEDFQTDAEKARDAAENSDDTYDWSSSESEHSLVGDMGSLLLRHERIEFEEAQRQKYLRKKKKWIKGGNHKRSHKESLGSESDTEDIVPLDDADVVGSSARRLRRRTDTMELRPRTSLLFEDPPREIEELKFLEGDGGVIESDDELVPAWMYPGMEVDQSDSEDEDDDESIPVIYLPPTRARR